MSKVGETLTKEQSKAGWKRLTAKQQRFLDNFMYRDMTQTASARESGYSNPTVDAVRLLRNPVVQERYQEMRMEANARFGVTVEKSVRDLLKMRNEAWENGKIGEAIRAEELRLKATGLLVNKQHIMHEDMNGLSREQILEKLDDFKKLAQGRMRNVTPAEDVRVEIVDNSEKMGKSGK
jgi:phage terminase small subunit